MMIDWFTVVAQLFNFVVLVWLLKRFLYKPILRAIDERENRIAAETAVAGKMRAEAQTRIDEFRQKNQEFDRQRDALLHQAIEEVQAEKTRLLDEARQSAETLRSKLLETLRSEQRQLQQEFRRRMQQEVFAIARKTLTDLAGLSLEQRIADSFVQRLRDLPQKKKGLLSASLATSSDPGIISTAFELPPVERAAIEAVLIELFGAETQVRFETSPDLISGIEFSMNGQKVAWSIDDYLQSMEQSLDEIINAQRKPEVAAVDDPTVDKFERSS
jgi:F-type H+-transporting ATPase subunit b